MDTHYIKNPLKNAEKPETFQYFFLLNGMTAGYIALSGLISLDKGNCENALCKGQGYSEGCAS